MNHTPGLLVLDIDGTFLNSAKQTSPVVMDAIRGLVARGFPVTFASGRMVEAFSHWVEELGINTPLVANNGADIVVPGTWERLVSYRIPPAVVGNLLDYGAANELTTILFSHERVLGRAHTDDDWLIERNNEMVTALSEEELRSPQLEVQKLLFLAHGTPDRLVTARDELLTSEAWGEFPFVCQISETGILNISHPDATKLRMVGILCNRLGLRLDQVVAIGDGDNDAEILGAVGLGIAMGNASLAARKAARMTVPDCDHDGVAVAIRDILLPAIEASEGDVTPHNSPDPVCAHCRFQLLEGTLPARAVRAPGL